jgi:PPOX class probable F420-dependent enzyme
VTTLEEAVALATDDRGLAVIATLRADGTIQASLVNTGIIVHPSTGEPVLAFVTNGRAKLSNLRVRQQVTATLRNGWRWAAVEGIAEIAGPDDTKPYATGDSLRVLLRTVFVSAGGEHEDWEEYDRVMAQERRAAVLITPRRIYSN